MLVDASPHPFTSFAAATSSEGGHGVEEEEVLLHPTWKHLCFERPWSASPNRVNWATLEWAVEQQPVQERPQHLPRRKPLRAAAGVLSSIRRG